MDIHERLKWARKNAFPRPYPSAADAARALSVPYPTYAAHENKPEPTFRAPEGKRYAKKFGVSFDWLMTGDGEPRAVKLVPIVGRVGAGTRVIPFDDLQGAPEMVSAPPDAPKDCVAVAIDGDSMLPFESGWLLFYRREQEGVPDDCVGKLCVVQVHEDKAVMVKRLRRARAPKLWNLESWAASLQENVRLDWAARVLFIRPR